MAYNLVNKPISSSFDELIQIDENNFLRDGSGSLRTELKTTGSISASTYYGDGSNLSGVTATLPSGVVSGSSQIIAADTDGFSTSVKDELNSNSVVSGSSQITLEDTSYTDNGEFSFLQTDGAGNLSFEYVHSMYDNIYAGEDIVKGDPVYVSGSQGANPIVYKADASDSTKAAVYIAGESITSGNTGLGIILGEIEGIDLTGLTDGQNVYLAEGGGWSTSRPSGSNSIVQALGIVTKGGSGGKGQVLNPGPATLPNLADGYAWVGDGGNQPTAVATSSFGGSTDISALNAFTASQETINTGYNAYTSSTDARLTSIESTTASLETNKLDVSTYTTDSASFDTRINDISASGSGADWNVNLTNIPSGLVSGSSQVDYTGLSNIPSGIVSGSDQVTSSLDGRYATLASDNTFTANQTITGSVSILGNLNDKVALGSNTQVDIFELQTPPVVAGNTYNVHTIGYQNYEGYGNQYSSSFAIEFADSLSYNYYSGLYMNGGNFTYNLSPSGSVPGKIKSSLRMRENNDIHGTTKTELWGTYLELNAIGSGTIDLGSNTFSKSINIGSMNTNAGIPVAISISGSTESTGSWGHYGDFSSSRDALSTNEQVDLFTLASAQSNGNNYDIAYFGYQSYPSYGNSYEDIFAIEYADSVSYNYSNGFYINGGNTNLNLTVSGSPSISSTMRMRDNGDGTATTTIFGGTVDVSAIGNGTLKLGDNGFTSQINLGGSGTSTTISGSISHLGDYTISGKVEQTFGAPATNNQIDLLTITGSTDNDSRAYNVFTVGIQDYPSYGASYGDAYVIEKYDSTSYNFGSSMLISGPRAQLSMQVSGSGNIAVLSARENGSLAQAMVSGDETLIIASNGKNTISGSVDMESTLTASLAEGYVWVGGAGNRTTLAATSSFGGGGGFPYTGDAEITGSLGVTKAIGGGVTTLSITSNTASIDLTDSNTYELTLVSSADTHLDVSTFGEDAQSINILVKQPAAGNTGSISFSPDFKFGQGYSYIPTPSNSSEDMISFLRVGSYLYGTYINNFS